MLIGRDFVRGQKRFDFAPTILFDCTSAGGASSCRATLLFSSATSKAAASSTRPLRGRVGRTPKTSSTKNFLDEFLHRPKKSKPEPSPPRSWSRSISNRQPTSIPLQSDFPTDPPSEIRIISGEYSSNSPSSSACSQDSRQQP